VGGLEIRQDVGLRVENITFLIADFSLAIGACKSAIRNPQSANCGAFGAENGPERK
jgi:hypothetical protein